jgi:hypothetical protein
MWRYRYGLVAHLLPFGGCFVQFVGEFLSGHKDPLDILVSICMGLAMLDKIIEFVKQPRTLWVAFGVVMLLSLGFQWVRPHVGDVLLDELADSTVTLAQLALMSTEQLWAHIAMTTGFDFLFPVAYGVLFGGLIIRAFCQYSPALLLPLVILIIADVTENIAQIALLALSLIQVDGLSLAGVAWFKSVASSTKFSMLYLTLGIVALALLRMGARKLVSLRSSAPISNDSPKN